MKIGIFLGGPSVAACREGALAAADEGFTHGWFAHIFGVEGMTACTVAGAALGGRMEVGTFVVPVQPRHPFAMAQQAASTWDACEGAFTLGIGLSHQIVIQTMLGLPFERHVALMREYLTVLHGLLVEGAVAHDGEFFKVRANLERARTDAPEVLVAALGPQMLRVTGALADGTATWMTGPQTLADHVVPTISKAAADAGRHAPRILVGLPICLTNDVDTARQRAATEFAVYGQLPSYRAMLDREGAAGPADVAIVGDEAALTKAIGALTDAGATDFNAAFFGDPADIDRTRALVASLAAA